MAHIHNIDLTQFFARVADLSRDAFLAAYPVPFLLVEKEESPHDSGEFHTVFPHSRTQPVPLPTDHLNPSDLRLKLVSTLEKSGRNTFKNKITVGRSVNNDIVVNHPSVSKFHAIFQYNAEGKTYMVGDMGSSNGTKLDGRALSSSEPVPIASAQSVIFGSSVAGTFFYPTDFYDYLDVMRRAWGLE